jgi:transmembrane sensor
MSSAKIKLSNLVRATKTPPPDVDESWRRLRRGLDERHTSRARRRMFMIPAFSLAMAAAVAAVWYVDRSPDAGVALDVGRAFESTTTEVALALPDGVHVDMGSHSRVAVEEVSREQIRVALGHGHARFEVEPHHKRRFIVDVDGIEVRVVGTKFSVSRAAGTADDETRVDVAVERGIVEVRNRFTGELHRLRAGERFSALVATPAEGAQAAPPATDEATGSQETEEAAEDEDAAPARQVSPSIRSHAHSTHVPRQARGEARLLLEAAQSQWREGHMAAAASMYEEILARFPTDARAGLAALELGRIRMDHLGDLEGAVVSLQRAVRLAPAASFHEDALARLVTATERLNRRDDCVRARRAYLSRYPEGIHAGAVAKACE